MNGETLCVYCVKWKLRLWKGGDRSLNDDRDIIVKLEEALLIQMEFSPPH